MKRKSAIQNSWLYRHRYPIAIIILIVLAAFMVGYRFWSMPSGLSRGEAESLQVSGNLSLSSPFHQDNGQPLSIVALPWTLLQYVSIKLFGPSLFGLRLPAVILTLITGLLGIILLRKLTRPSLAMIGGFLMVSSAFFIGMGRSGTAAAMTTLLITTTVLLCYLLINQPKPNRVSILIKSGIVLALALLCYMPGGLYLTLAILLAGVLHPRTRLILMQGKLKSLPYLIAFIVLIAPIVIVPVTSNHAALRELLLLDSSWPFDNISEVLIGYAGTASGITGGYITPILTIADLILVVIGLIAVIRAMSSVRAYVLAIFGVVAGLLTFANPELIFILFVPSIILETIGVGWVVDKWYNLFPRNPYARTFAIVPLTVLIVSIGWLNINRYFNTLNYNREVAYQYNYEYPAVVRELLQQKQTESTVIVVADDQYRLYSPLIYRYHVAILRSSDDEVQNLDGGKVMAVASSQVTPRKMKIDKVVSGWTIDQSDLLKVYK